MVQRMLCWGWHPSNYLSQPNIAAAARYSLEIQIILPNVDEKQTRGYFPLQNSLDSLNSKLSCLFKANAKLLLGKSKYNIVYDSKQNFGNTDSSNKIQDGCTLKVSRFVQMAILLQSSIENNFLWNWRERWYSPLSNWEKQIWKTCQICMQSINQSFIKSSNQIWFSKDLRHISSHTIAQYVHGTK